MCILHRPTSPLDFDEHWMGLYWPMLSILKRKNIDPRAKDVNSFCCKKIKKQWNCKFVKQWNSKIHIFCHLCINCGRLKLRPWVEWIALVIIVCNSVIVWLGIIFFNIDDLNLFRQIWSMLYLIIPYSVRPFLTSVYWTLALIPMVLIIFPVCYL